MAPDVYQRNTGANNLRINRTMSESSSSSSSSKKSSVSKKNLEHAYSLPWGNKERSEIISRHRESIKKATAKSAKTKKNTKQITQNMLNLINEEKDVTAKEQIHHIRDYVESLGLSRSEERTRLNQILNGFFRALAERADPEERESLISKYRFYKKPTSFRKLFNTINGREQSYTNRGKKISRSLRAHRAFSQIMKHTGNWEHASRVAKHTRKNNRNHLSTIKEEK